jgi:sec-independent protein translocase protein TatA
MFGLGAGELFLIFMIAVMFLGPKKIPELAKGIGQAFREFEKSRNEMIEDSQKVKVETDHAVKESKAS